MKPNTDTGNIREIVRLEGLANAADKDASSARWAASHLINEELRFKTYRQLSQEIKEAGGKGSIGHLERMSKCWDVVGQLHWESMKDDFDAYPNFTAVYQSEEIRGEGDGQGSQRHRGQGGEERPDDSPHGIAAAVASGVDVLARNPAMRQLLTDDDMGLLRQARDQLRTILRESTR